ncbi:hypothetical protein Emtol_2369 [Emticicia oligotrophica DSM 17448]|uniref:YhhN-like protein n=1 Tax=Emticicia oligotrophica (strain DSM 17448 / CIP 109782 / MTCC 6937 / GPTSA100-15) TaxID=929562 RepID=A0ABM5N231_EMTOG|nr:hypothetical protein Emtol_2369 [Emticicia oligotrophica DSM 17448]
MSKRFTALFFSLLVIVNLYFTVKVEPHELKTQVDKLLALFLFQFDYFLLFVYIFSKLLRNFHKSLLVLAACYACLFILGMASFYITDEKQFDIVYSYSQPILRLLLIIVFYWMGLRFYFLRDKVSLTFYAIAMVEGFYLLFLLNRYPRALMYSFNIYWLVVLLFFVIGIQVRINFKNRRLLFLIGILFTFTADLYYILPPEERVFEFTYIIIRLINTIGEFLIVNHVLRYYNSIFKK